MVRWAGKARLKCRRWYEFHRAYDFTENKMEVMNDPSATTHFNFTTDCAAASSTVEFPKKSSAVTWYKVGDFGLWSH